MLGRLKPVGLGLLIALPVAGCADNDFFGPDRVPKLGILADHDQPTDVISVPDTVTAGVEFTVSVTTRGGGCDQKDGTSVETVDGAVQVSPFDIFYVGDNVCPSIGKQFAHSVQLRFDDPGEETIRVRARTGSGDQDEVLVLTHTVTVEASDGS